MATFKTLDDYCVISHDFASGIIDRANYDELLEDLQTEIESARELRLSLSPPQSE